MSFSRDYSNFDRNLSNLFEDVYDQPDDAGHTGWANEFLEWVYAVSNVLDNRRKILDVGCGQGFCRDIFEKDFDLWWHGVTVGEDFKICRRNGLPVDNADMTFLPYADNSWDILFARHTLEHSPFPILTLMEWRRVTVDKLLLVLPAPEFWGVSGKNHYSVLYKNQWWNLFTRAGWEIEEEKTITTHDKEFLNHYRPELEGKARTGIFYPGAPKEIEYWYILKKGEERIE